MRIDPAAPKPPLAVRRAAPAGGARSDAFAKALAEGGQPAAVTTAATVGPLGPVLALQEVADATDGGAQARRRGEDLLDRLEEMRLDLLAGAIPRPRLEELARLIRARREGTGDPRLAAILDDIELRAAVELAKLAPRG